MAGNRSPSRSLATSADLWASTQLLLQQFESSLFTVWVVALQVLLALELTMLPLALEVAIPAGHLSFDLALRLKFEAGFGALPFLHDLLGVVQIRSLFLHSPGIPALVLM